MPTGDYIKKEREGLDLIIGMHKKNERKAVPIGEFIVFIVVPLAIAGGIWKAKELTEFAQKNEQVSAMIKMVYPQWKSAAELAPPPLPIEQAGIPGEQGQPVPGGTEQQPGVVPSQGATPTAPAAGTNSYAGNPQPQPSYAAPPEEQGAAQRGSLLH